MLRIRLTRTGRKNRPHYRVVVAEHSAPIKGKFIEILGSFDPRTKKIQLKKEEIMAWLKKGAKPSNTVAKLLKREGLKHKSITVIEYHKKAKTEVKAEEKPATQPQVENNPSPVEPANLEEKTTEPTEKATKPVVEPKQIKEENQPEPTKEEIKSEQKS